MTRVLFLLSIPFLLFGAQILSYNVYDRTDRVDVMITFDTPYEGKIKQSTSQSKIIIKLENSSIETTKTKVLSSKFLNTISIVPLAGYTQIVAEIPPGTKLKASKTSDSYGLRLRFTSFSYAKNNTKTSYQPQSNESSLTGLPTKQPEDISTNYYIVIGTLLIGIVILFVLKNKVASMPQQKQGNSWLFKVANDAKHGDDGSVTIRFQKQINEANSVVMLDFAEQSYLVLMGSNNILLDKFTDNKPVTQDDFETILQNRHQELDDFLNNQETIEKDPMQIYKEKAANISYTS